MNRGAIEMSSAFRSSWVVFLLAFVVLGLCAGASAQVSKGSISGTVMDPQGAVVPGATVRSISADTDQSTSTVTDNSGLFKLPLLPIGSYRVEVSRAGFRKASLPGIAVTPGVDTGLGTIKLEIGSASETHAASAARCLGENKQ